MDDGCRVQEVSRYVCSGRRSREYVFEVWPRVNILVSCDPARVHRSSTSKYGAVVAALAATLTEMLGSGRYLSYFELTSSFRMLYCWSSRPRISTSDEASMQA